MTRCDPGLRVSSSRLRYLRGKWESGSGESCRAARPEAPDIWKECRGRRTREGGWLPRPPQETSGAPGGDSA